MFHVKHSLFSFIYNSFLYFCSFIYLFIFLPSLDISQIHLFLYKIPGILSFFNVSIIFYAIFFQINFYINIYFSSLYSLFSNYHLSCLVLFFIFSIFSALFLAYPLLWFILIFNINLINFGFTFFFTLFMFQVKHFHINFPNIL